VPEAPRIDPVSAPAHAAILAKVASVLSADSRVMVIGGGLMLESGVRRVLTTKDEDLVLLVLQGGALKVAEVAAVEQLVRELGGEPFVRKDQTSVSFRLKTPRGTFLIEFVRGRRGGHGYFVSRQVLEAVAALSRREGRVLTPPLEALAFLKAWAAVDKAKLVASGRDGHGYHAARERSFRIDADAIRERVLEKGQADARVFRTLLGASSPARALAVRNVLREAGWDV
jgi:hypothetical protein